MFYTPYCICALSYQPHGEQQVHLWISEFLLTGSFWIKPSQLGRVDLLSTLSSV